MTDDFSVTAVSANVLEQSDFVDAVSDDVSDDASSVVYAGYAFQFDDVSGGYIRDKGYHLLKLHISQPSKFSTRFEAGSYELHTETTVWSCEVQEVRYFESDGGYTLAMMVTGYEKYPYTYANEMRERVDGRWTEYDGDLS